MEREKTDSEKRGKERRVRKERRVIQHTGELKVFQVNQSKRCPKECLK